MTIPGFELCEPGQRVPRNQVHLCAEKTRVVRVNAVPTCRAWDAGHVVEIVMGVREPETMPFQGDTKPGKGSQLEDSPNIVNILQRQEIHVAIEFVIRWKQIIKGSVSAVSRVAVTGGIVILQAKPWLGWGIDERVAALNNRSKRLL